VDHSESSIATAVLIALFVTERIIFLTSGGFNHYKADGKAGSVLNLLVAVYILSVLANAASTIMTACKAW
jgi:hypothetical protein